MSSLDGGPLPGDSDSEKTPVLTIPESLIPSPTHLQPHITTTTLDGLLRTPLRLKEDLAEGCGGKLWPAGLVLAKYVVRAYGGAHGEGGLGEKKIVELGAGSGLVGLALALSLTNFTPSQPMYLTDRPPMLPLLRSNILLNNLQDIVQPLVLSWGEPAPEPILTPPYPDIILAADCVYFEPAFPLLLQTLTELVGSETVVFFCFKKRRRADLHLMKKARKIFNVEDVLDDPDRSTYSRENIFL